MRGGAPPFELSGRRETRAELIRMRGVLLYVTLTVEGANEADGPLSAACGYWSSSLSHCPRTRIMLTTALSSM